MSPRDTTLGTPTKRRIHGVKGLRRETLTISTGFVKPDTLSYNTVIASCGQWHMALRLLQDMTRHQVLEMDGAGHGGVWIEKWLRYMFTSDLLGVQGCRIMIAVDSWNPTLHQKRILCSTRCHVSMAQLPFPQFISEIYPTLCLFNRIQPNNVQTNSPPFFPAFLSLPTLPTGSLENRIFTDIFPTGKMQLSQLHGSPPVLYGCFARAKGHAVRSNHQNQNSGRWSAMAVETVGLVWCKVGVPLHGCQWFGCLSGGGTVVVVNMGCLRLVEKNDRSLMSVHVHDYQWKVRRGHPTSTDQVPG